MSINVSIHAFFGIELLQTCIEKIVKKANVPKIGAKIDSKIFCHVSLGKIPLYSLFLLHIITYRKYLLLGFILQLTIPELFYKIKNLETRTTSMPIGQFKKAPTNTAPTCTKSTLPPKDVCKTLELIFGKWFGRKRVKLS